MTTKNPDDNPESTKIKRTSLLLNLKGTLSAVAVFVRMQLGGSLKSVILPNDFHWNDPPESSSTALTKLYIRMFIFVIPITFIIQ